MSVDRIVTVNIQVQTEFPSAANFGTPMLFAYHTFWTDRVRSFNSLQAVTDAGVTTTHPIYYAAQAHFSQNPHIIPLKVGKRLLAYTKSWELTPTSTTTGDVVGASIDGNAFSYTVQAADTVADIVDGLKIAFDALSLAYTSTDDATHLTIDATVAGVYGYVDTLLNADLEDVTADPGIATDYAAIALEDSDFFGILMDSKGTAEATAMAALAASNTKIFAVQTNQSDIVNTTDAADTTSIAAVLKAANNDNTAVIYHEKPTEFIDAAIMAKRFALSPGTYTWAHTELDNITKSSLNDTQITNALDKNTNVYVDCKGIGDWLFGRTAGGEFADTARFVPYVDDLIQTNVLGVKQVNDKVPMTNGGLQVIGAEIRRALFTASDPDGTGVGGLDPDTIVVTVPDVTDISVADRANRCATGFTFRATLSGAIHKTTINGTVSA